MDERFFFSNCSFESAISYANKGTLKGDVV